MRREVGAGCGERYTDVRVVTARRLVLAVLAALVLGFLAGWQTERCQRVGWLECAKWPVMEIGWSGR